MTTSTAPNKGNVPNILGVHTRKHLISLGAHTSWDNEGSGNKPIGAERETKRMYAYRKYTSSLPILVTPSLVCLSDLTV